MKKMNDFTVFIISYQRPDRVYTYRTLRKQGYTGDVYIVVSEDDNTVEEYKKKFKNKVVVFNKDDYEVDLFDNLYENKRTDLFSRIASYDIARKLGYRYFLVLDDDYEGFYFMCDSKGRFRHIKVKNLDRLFKSFLEFYKVCKQVDILSFAQMGDFIGGRATFESFVFGKRGRMVRKAMNVFFCDVERRVEFLGRYNDDVNTFLYWGMRGRVFLTIFMVAIIQKLTQTNRGGMSEGYREHGTYWKSFSSVLVNPSAVRVSVMGVVEKRVHHNVLWEYAVPYILPFKYF